MPDDVPPPAVAFAHVRGKPDEDGRPALLVQPAVVLVPEPPAELTDRAVEIEVVVVGTDDAPVPVERIRVSAAQIYAGARATTLVLGLERDSVLAPSPIGSPEEEQLFQKVVETEDHDLWGTLRRLERVPELPASVPADALERLRTHEAEPHPPAWPGPIDFPWNIFAALFRRR